MENNPNFRNANLKPGQILGELRLGVSLVADNTVVNPGVTPYLLISSDNATPANRTFTLTNGSYDGAVLHLTFITATNSCQLANSGNVSLAAAWEPTQNQTLTLQWDAQLSLWRELSRQTGESGDITTLQADVDALEIDMTAAQGDITALETDQPYTAGTPGDWATAAPTSTKEALDRISAAVEGLLVGPIP